MLRFVIVAVLLFVLVVFYATRLGEEPPPEREYAPSSTSDVAQPVGSAPVAPGVRSEGSNRDWFPDLQQRQALLGDIGATGAATQSFGCDVDELIEDDELVLADKSGSEESALGKLMNTLTASSDAELQIAAMALQRILLSDADEAAALHTLQAAMRLDPTNPTVLWHVSNACTEGEELEICGSSVTQSAIEAALHGNGAFWAREALTHNDAGDRAAALEALQRASIAPEFNLFQKENVRLLERALALTEDIGFVERTLGAYIFAQELAYGADYVLLMCHPRAVEDPAWFAACLTFAERAIVESSRISQQLTAAQVLTRLYYKSERHSDYERALVLFDEIDDLRLDRSPDSITVLLTDERVLSLFMEEFEAAGDLAAMRFLTAEVGRLKQDPDYDPCPPDDEPGAAN